MVNLSHNILTTGEQCSIRCVPPEELGKEEKEGFIEALVKFDDGCNDFYRDRAYFLAAAGIVEFKDCSLADEIVSQIIKWGFTSFNEKKQKGGHLFIEPIAKGSREILKETDRERAISTLVELINTSQKGYTWWHAAKSLGIIGKNNPVAIAALVEFIGTCQDELIRMQAAKSLRIISKSNPVAIVAVSGLKDCLISEIKENDYNRYENYIGYEFSYQVIWNCAQNMTYPDFYQAWHTQPTNSPVPDHDPQNTDIPTLLKQLQPTDKTFPVPLNIRALEGETDSSAIAQELCTQIYQAIFPADTDIPAIRNAPEFKRLIPQLKNRLQKQHIALILHSCTCEDALSSLGHKLADTQMGIHIAWITDTPLELPLTGFPPNQDDLLNAVQNWIGGIGSRSRGRT